VPIIVLSARSDTSDIVKALGSGANDYVKKPFDMPELVARVKSAIAQHTHKSSDPEVNIYSFGNLVVDITDHKTLINDESIHLSKKEFLILKMLVENSGKLVMQNDILQYVWGNCYGDGPQYLRVYIGQLRKKLSACSINPLISTEKGVGYRIAASDEYSNIKFF
jgi:two-component system KDP operon response regulator KdpE